MPHSKRERYRLDLEALPSWGAPAVIRLRRFLKAALRAYGLKCTSATVLHSDGKPDPLAGEERQR
jgi:hypothetical protein